MQTIRIGHSCANIRHISKNNLKNNNLVNKTLIIPRSRSLIRYNTNKGYRESQSDNYELTNENNGLLSKYLENLKCDVTIWGSSLIELGVKLNNLSYLRNKNRFLRRFRKIELISNGSKYIPNSFQLASLRPQLTGSDLLINSPKGSGKTLMYLLPHIVTNYIYNNSVLYKNNLNTDLNDLNQRLIVLLPTIDLVVDESRTAYGCFRKFKNVSSLLYKDLVLNNLNQILEADIIYSTPKTFLKFLIKYPKIHSTIRFIVVDESERITFGEFSSILVRIRDLLPIDVQYIFLSNFTHNHLLNQFTSRFLKLNFKIISYNNNNIEPIKHIKNDTECNNNNDFNSLILYNRVTKHIYGPIRDIKDHVKIYNYINNNIDNKDNNNNKIEEYEEIHELKDNKEKEKQDNLEVKEDNVKRIQLKENWPIVYDLEMKIKRNLDLIMNNDKNSNNLDNKDNNNNNNKYNNYNIEYVLYEPSKFVEALLSELDVNKKTLVYFPTVKMCQFCYLYFKHYLKVFSRDTISSSNKDNKNSKDKDSNMSLRVDIDTPTNKDNNYEDSFIFYDFHTGLSLDKRRFVMDNFKLTNRGILFCTNLAIGVNFNNINKIIQVSFTFNIYELLNKFQFTSINNINNNNSNNNSSNKNSNINNIIDNNYNKDKIERIMLLNNLDGHILYEYYKNNINVVLKRTFTEPFNSYRNIYNYNNIDDQDNNNNINNIIDNNYNKDSNKDNTNSNDNNMDLIQKIDTTLEENKPKIQLEWDIYLLSSCELMYRSLLGYYCENSMKLKLEKWTIPSFFNEFTSSFGISHNFKVSKQFASRTQLINSPGLEISSNCNRKTDLMASLKSYPGFISKSQQSRIII